MVKKKIIKDFTKVRGKLLDLVSRIRPDKTDEVFLGIWSIKDVLAHLIGWDEANLQATKEIIDGRLPSYFSL